MDKFCLFDEFVRVLLERKHGDSDGIFEKYQNEIKVIRERDPAIHLGYGGVFCIPVLRL